MASTIGTRIRQLREAKRLSVAEFAVAAGVKPSAIYGLESGANKPSIETVSSLRHSFPDLSTDWLLDGTGPMRRDGRALSAAPQLPFLGAAPLPPAVLVAPPPAADAPVFVAPVGPSIDYVEELRRSREVAEKALAKAEAATLRAEQDTEFYKGMWLAIVDANSAVPDTFPAPAPAAPTAPERDSAGFKLRQPPGQPCKMSRLLAVA